MSRQMHQMDEEPTPRRNRFTFDSQPSEPIEAESGRVRREAAMSPESEQAWEEDPTDLRREVVLPHGAADKTAADTPAVQVNFSKIFAQVISSVVGIGLITATLFSIWMPGSASGKAAQAASAQMELLTPEPAATLPANYPAKRIGIVVGHRGSDSGAVCSNGLTELEVNSNVATFVQMKLIDMGYEVDLLDEFDARLANYQAGLLLSIHADSCDYINDSATGFKVASAMSAEKSENSKRLVQCIADRYAQITGLRYHYQSVTDDMTRYHAFTEIDPRTTAGIIEIGFLNLDQSILTSKPELLADGIVAGIKCYINNEGVSGSGTQQ